VGISLLVRDVARLGEKEIVLTLSEYEALIEQAPILIWRANTDKLCDYFNHRWLAFTGRTMKQEYGNGWAEGVHPDDLDQCIKIYVDSFDKHEIFEMHYRLKRFDGAYRWLLDRGVPYYSEDDEFSGYIGSCIDVTESYEAKLELQKHREHLEELIDKRTEELKITNEKLEKLSFQDGLTGIPNRRMLDLILNKEWDRGVREKQPLSLIMVDVDYFKQYNDHYGHIQGDECLKSIANELTQIPKRAADLCARYGGEEFVLLLPNTNQEEAIRLAERLRAKILKLKLSHEHSNICDVVSISAGVSTIVPMMDISPLSLTKAADTALYQAKSNGRNRVESK